ncbi:MAG: hypothetical protein KGZ63_09470 [Clostridiales bacterium]|jgi:hypothetical protein|nr:hypothetical protein [Clostridiales bacterium]
MTQQKPKALTVEEFIKSATMFYIDTTLEKQYADSVSASVNELQTRLLGIATSDGLKKYIGDDRESLDRITSLLNISEEKFKRIITMLRIQKRHMPTSEWSLSKVREQMVSSSAFMNEICDLLMKGATLDKYKSLIPAYYLENFQIDASTLGRLASPDDIRRLVKKGLEGNYNNRIGDSFFKCASDAIIRGCEATGLTYAIKKNVPIVGKVVSVAIPDESNPKLLIDITYGITTSSAQTRYAERAEAKAIKIRELNSKMPPKQHIGFVNVVDGAGWVARQSDLNKIERCSNYLLNLQTLGSIGDIINYYNGRNSQ